MAMLRACAALHPSGAYAERCSGITYYRWLCELEQEFDARADTLIETLQALCQTLFTTARMRLSVTGGSRQSAQLVASALRSALPAGIKPSSTQQKK